MSIALCAHSSFAIRDDENKLSLQKHFCLWKWLVIMQSSRNVMFDYLQRRSRWAHRYIFLSGGIEHGSKGNELLNSSSYKYLLGLPKHDDLLYCWMSSRCLVSIAEAVWEHHQTNILSVNNHNNLPALYNAFQFCTWHSNLKLQLNATLLNFNGVMKNVTKMNKNKIWTAVDLLSLCKCTLRGKLPFHPVSIKHMKPNPFLLSKTRGGGGERRIPTPTIIPIYFLANSAVARNTNNGIHVTPFRILKLRVVMILGALLYV